MYDKDRGQRRSGTRGKRESRVIVGIVEDRFCICSVGMTVSNQWQNLTPREPFHTANLPTCGDSSLFLLDPPEMSSDHKN